MSTDFDGGPDDLLRRLLPRRWRLGLASVDGPDHPAAWSAEARGILGSVSAEGRTRDEALWGLASALAEYRLPGTVRALGWEVVEVVYDADCPYLVASDRGRMYAVGIAVRRDPLGGWTPRDLRWTSACVGADTRTRFPHAAAVAVLPHAVTSAAALRDAVLVQLSQAQ